MEPLRLHVAWRAIEATAVLIVRGLMGWRVDVRGLEHVPRDGGAVLAFNHHSYFDFVMVAWAVVRQLRRPVRFLAKREIWQSRLFGPIVRAAGAVPVDRRSATARGRAYAAAVEALAVGDLVAVAPEQTISRSFQLLPLRTGAVRMAQQAGVDIVPAIGWGTQRFATKDRGIHLARRIPVAVRYGAPLQVTADEDPVAATARLQRAMEALLDEVQRDYPPPTRPTDDWWQPARLGGGAPPHDEVLREHRSRTGRWDPDAGRDPGS